MCHQMPISPCVQFTVVVSSVDTEAKGHRLTLFLSELFPAILPLLHQSDRHSDPELHWYVLFSASRQFVSKTLYQGTGVWVIGGRRSISGSYSVQIDDQPVQSFGANTGNITQFQATLGGGNGLPFGDHTIVVKNLSTDSRQQVLDIDSFIVETAAGNESGLTFSGPTVIDDANPAITYSASRWATTSRIAPPNTPWRNGTVHESNVNGAQVEFSFEGRGVSVIGAVGPRNGNFRVQLDGRDVGELSARASILHPATPIVSLRKLNLAAGWVLTNPYSGLRPI